MSTHSTAVKMAFAFLAVYRIVAILFMVVGSSFGVLFAYIVLSSEAPLNTKVAILGFEIVFYIIFLFNRLRDATQAEATRYRR